MYLILGRVMKLLFLSHVTSGSLALVRTQMRGKYPADGDGEGRQTINRSDVQSGYKPSAQANFMRRKLGRWLRPKQSHRHEHTILRFRGNRPTGWDWTLWRQIDGDHSRKFTLHFTNRCSPRSTVG